MRNLSLPCGNTWRSSQQWHRSGEGLFLQSDISTMQEASSHYAGMTGYQKSQLTGQEQAQWEALVEAYGEDGSNHAGKDLYADL